MQPDPRPPGAGDAAFFQRARDLYDGIAPAFDSSRGRAPWAPLVEFTSGPAARDALSAIPLGGIALDLGCGNGRNMAYIKAMFHARACVGLDLSASLLRVARARDGSRPLPDVVQASMTALPFRDGTFAAVACVAALHHSPSKASMRETIGRVRDGTRGGGVLVLSVWRKWQARFRAQVARNIISLKPRPGLVHVPWKDARDGTVHDREYYLLSRRELARMLRSKFCIASWAVLGGPGGADNIFFLATR
ncbi:MAG: methyltransferase domain-containing protein [Candidatus Lokiarchaeota archaeon]|nr:methyltransferase domain-containing protein [Candidatus Lokiarchaeota archaeon]